MSQNNLIVDPKPSNERVVDSKPQNQSFSNPVETEQGYTVVVQPGQTMGLLLALTYPELGTYISYRA